MQCGVRDDCLLSVGVFEIDHPCWDFSAREDSVPLCGTLENVKYSLGLVRAWTLLGLDLTELYYTGKSL